MGGLGPELVAERGRAWQAYFRGCPLLGSRGTRCWLPLFDGPRRFDLARVENIVGKGEAARGQRSVRGAANPMSDNIPADVLNAQGARVAQLLLILVPAEAQVLELVDLVREVE